MTDVNGRTTESAEALDQAIKSILSVNDTLATVTASHEALGRVAAQHLQELEATTRSRLDHLIVTNNQQLDSQRRQADQMVGAQVERVRSDLSAIMQTIESNRQQVVDLFQTELDRVTLDRRTLLDATEAAAESVEAQLRATIQQSAVIAHEALTKDREMLRAEATKTLDEERHHQRTYAEAEMNKATAANKALLEQRLKEIETSLREAHSMVQAPEGLDRRVEALRAWVVMLGIVVFVLLLVVAVS